MDWYLQNLQSKVADPAIYLQIYQKNYLKLNLKFISKLFKDLSINLSSKTLLDSVSSSLVCMCSPQLMYAAIDISPTYTLQQCLLQHT